MKRLLLFLLLLALASGSALAQRNAYEPPRLANTSADTDSILVRLISLLDSTFQYQRTDSLLWSAIVGGKVAITEAQLETLAGSINLANTATAETVSAWWAFLGASFPFQTGAGIAQIIDGGASADTIRWNWQASSNFKVTLDEDTWIENPTNISQGYASMRICQPVGGNLAIVPGAGLDTAFDAIPVIHEGANECTTIFLQSHDGTNLAVSSNRPEKCTNTWEFGARATDITIPDSLQYRVPSQWTIVELRAMHRVAGDSLTTYDVQAGGSTSILSTLLTIDASETTSKDAATLYQFATDHTLADDEILEVVLVSGETQTTIPQEATVTVCYIE